MCFRCLLSLCVFKCSAEPILSEVVICFKVQQDAVFWENPKFLRLPLMDRMTVFWNYFFFLSLWILTGLKCLFPPSPQVFGFLLFQDQPSGETYRGPRAKKQILVCVRASSSSVLRLWASSMHLHEYISKKAACYLVFDEGLALSSFNFDPGMKTMENPESQFKKIENKKE